MTSRAWLGSFVVAVPLLLPSGAWAQGKQDFTVENRTGYDISHVYVSSSNSRDWGRDILGRNILRNDMDFDIEFDPAEKICEWDLKITYAVEISDASWRNIDLCVVSVIMIHYDGNTGESAASFR